ncbi:MAG: hypothetical protein Kow0089_10350 [Desulfobulbaceae bacterium]
MVRFLKKLFFLLILFFLLAAVGAGGWLYWEVAVDPGPEIELSYIESILGRESPVFYRDGKEKIGVLFQDAHRQYIPYHRIPKQFVNAIVAAEDDQFFNHIGIDFLGIARAMVANIRAGRIVQGGSTITQQTAKNLFKRESRTFRAKLKELLYALRLEYHYSKEKILEFYVNQFFVSGNGHGLGVAARYYFDKDVDELTLLENAFIAGSVKRPNYYNPFTKASEEGAAKARQRAAQRAAYVLRQMRRLQFITDAQFREAMGSEIAFHRGRMSFALNTIMDMVRDGLSAPQVEEALDDHGISNVSTSGIRIVTTIDREVQEITLAALRRELSRLDIRLRGYDRDEVQREYGDLEYSGDTVVKPGAFMFGRIRAVETDKEGRPRVLVTLLNGKQEGIIDHAGLKKALTALVRFERQRWSEPGPGDMDLLLERLRQGDRVYVRVRETGGDGPVLLELEKYPLLQGAALVLQEGAVRALAGGMENRFYNRAVNARRLMGSTFKPLLFTAALQLGWSPLDMLSNRRNVFVYQDMPYFPRPDHHSPHEKVSMSWAGVQSENLAAIWLLYHLTDHLTPPRLQEVAAYLGLAPDANGTTSGSGYFRELIRDRYGIVVNREILEQAAYDKAVRQLEADFLFEGRVEEYGILDELPYGLHFDRYSEEIRQELAGEEEIPRNRKDELELRLDILSRSYLGLKPSLEALRQNRMYYQVEASSDGALDPLAILDSASGNLRPVGMFWRDGDGRIVFSLEGGSPGWTLISERRLRDELLKMDGSSRDAFFGDVLVEGVVSMNALDQVEAQMSVARERLFAADPYSMEVLSEVRDYRVLVGLWYLIRLAGEMGVGSPLEPVLSFPLGSNVVTLLDAVRMFETMVTGERFFNYTEHFPAASFDETFSQGLAVIERIETAGGEIIYSRQHGSKRVLAPETALAVADILRNTVRHGTGRYAHRHVRLRSRDPERQSLLERLDQPLPLLGKTGTANEFRNSAFIGYVPLLRKDDAVMQLPGGYSVGVYVGFDDNRPMKRGTTRITGAGGALPTWSAIAQNLVNLNRAGDTLDMADLSFNGIVLRFDSEQAYVPVSPSEGGVFRKGGTIMRRETPPEEPAVLAPGKTSVNGEFVPERFFLPFWKHDRTGR